MGTMIFLICILLKKTEMNMGMALGLFAIFSIIRFRSENLVAKNMAYLFTVITVSVINAMFDFPHPVRGTIMVNLIIITTVFLLEIAFSKFSKEVETKEDKKALKKAAKEAGKKSAKKTEKEKFNRHEVLYDNLGLLSLDKTDDLLQDISKRTGIEIIKVRIKKIDLIKANAVLDVYYKGKSEKVEE
jgi:Ca2+/Na+ antiporter